jgi:hypothetical protein
MIERCSVANHVRTQDHASVVLDLVVALRRALRGQQIRPCYQAGRAHEDFCTQVGKRQVAARGGINNLILEFKERKADRVREGTGVEIYSYHVYCE